MDRRSTRLLMIGISLGLIGLVVIQVLWMRNNIELKEEQFGQAVGNALFAVSERLERMEKFPFLPKHEAGRRLMERLDTLRRPHMDGVGVKHKEILELHPHDTLAQHESWPLARKEHEQLVAEMVRSIVASRWERDPRDRVDPATLSKLLREEFQAHSLPMTYSYGIFDGEGEVILLPAEFNDQRAQLLISPYRERMFRYDIVGHELYLHVFIPGEHAMLIRSMLPMIIVSGVFVLIIMLAFFQTMRTIFRQKRINEIRNDLVNNLTHELKTPISTISLACEALTDPSVPKDDQQERKYVNMIKDENKRLGSLVENVLQSAVMDSGNMVLKRVDLDVHGVIQDVVRTSSIQVDRRNGRIDLDLQAEIHHLTGDRIHLTNVIYNLVDNAVKYTQKEPRITLGTRSNDEGISIFVTDNGIGIPRSEQPKIFDKLYRVPTGNIHNAKGFGLGLSYARTVVQRHGGRIEVDSEPGRGSTFKIFIPFEHVREHQAAVGRR